jgi:hypothetical protein
MYISVPYSRKATDMKAPRMAATAAWASVFTLAWSAARGRARPAAATAFRFFEPMSAPMPQRPAARPSSFMTAANGRPFSPAEPMQATLTFSSPNSFLIASWQA